MRLMFQKSRETDVLVKLFAEIPRSEMSFADATKRCGFRVYSTLPAYQSAKKIALRDHQIVIGPVRGFGFKKLTGPQIVDRGSSHLRTIRRKARGAASETEIALMQNLDRNQQQVASQNLTRFRLTADLTNNRVTTNRILVQEPELADVQK